MITFRASTEIPADRRVVIAPPPETPVGKAELIVTVAMQAANPATGGGLRRHFGAICGADPNAADNQRIDADLTRA